MTSRNLIHTTQMCKSRCTDLAPIWPFAAITYNKHTHLPFRRFNCCVCFARWHTVTLTEKQKMVDKCFHILLHRCSRWWSDLVIFHFDRTCWHLIETLVDDS